MHLIGKRSANEAISEINKIEKAMTKAFEPKLGLLNFDNFNKELKSSGAQIQNWGKYFSTAGVQGQQALVSMTSQLSRLDTGLRSVGKTTDKIFNTLGNTVRWGLIASGFQSILNSAHEAVDYIKELDRSLTDIRIVSNYNAQEMRDFSLQANDAAKALGQTTVAYTDASLIFSQQGFNIEDASRLAEMVLKVANTTGQATSEVSEQVTAWMNGMQMTIDQVETTLSKVTKVAAVGASDTEELMTAASKVASVAHMLGTTEDQLIAQMSTIISVTREAPENIGNALKTIYARMGDLKMGETLEDGTDLGKLGKTLSDVGVNIKDDNDELRSMGDILEELMGKWGSFDKAQQQALAVQLAGKYQYSRFTALMQNQEMYKEQLEASENAGDFLDRTQNIYMDSIAAKEQQLKASFEGLITDLFNGQDLKPFIEGLTDIVDLIDGLVVSLGGIEPILTGIGAISAKVFSKQMAQGISNVVNNKSTKHLLDENAEYRQKMMQNGFNATAINSNDERIGKFINFTDTMQPRLNSLSEDQAKTYNATLENQKNAINSIIQLEKDLKTQVDTVNSALKNRIDLSEDLITYDEEKQSYNFGQADQAVYFALDMEKQGSTEQMEKYRTSASNLTTTVMGLQTAFGKLTPETIKSGKGLDDLKSRLKTAYTSMNKMAESGVASDRMLESLRMSFSDFDNILSTDIKDLDVAQEVLDEIGRTIDDLIKSVNQGTADFSKKFGLDKLKEANAKMQELQAQIAVGERMMTDIALGTVRQQNIEQIFNMIGALGQLAFAIQSVNQIMAIWNNQDLEIGEKVVQIMVNIGFMLPMVASSINSLRTARSAIVDAIVAENIVRMVNLGLMSKEDAQLIIGNKTLSNREKIQKANAAAAALAAEAESAETLATMANTEATEKNTKATKENNAAKAGSPAASGMGEAADALDAVSDAATNTKNKTKDVGEALVKTGKKGGNAAKGLAKGFASFGRVLLPIIGKFAAIAAAAVVIGGATYAYYKWYVKEAEAAERAAENAKNMYTQYERMSEEYENLNEKIESFISLQSSMETMVIGTEEWNDALREANAILTEIIKKYPELAQYVTFDDHGQMKIDQEHLEDFQEKQEEQVRQQQRGTGMAQLAASHKQQIADDVSLGRKIQWYDAEASQNSDTYVGGNLSGEEVSALYDYMEDHGTQILEDPQQVAEALGLNVADPIVAAVVEMGDKVVAGFQERQSENAANDVQIRAMAEDIINSDAKYAGLEGPEREAAVKSVMGLIKENSEAGYDSELEQVKNMKTEDMAREYAELTGLEYNGVAGFTGIDGKGGEGKFVLEDGSTAEYSREVMEQQIATMRSLQNATEGIDEAVKNSWNGNKEEFAKSLSEQAANQKEAQNYSEEEQQQASEEVYNKISQAENLEDRDVALLQANVDPYTLIENIDEIIERINNGEEVEDIVLDYTVQPNDEMIADNVSGMTDAQLKASIDQLHELDSSIDETTVDRYARALSNSSPQMKEFIKNNERINNSYRDQIRQLEQQRDAKKRAKKSTLEEDQALEDLNKQLEQSENVLKTLAVQELQVQQGAKDLADGWEETKAVFSGDIALFDPSYVKALDETISSVSLLTNVDLSGLSDEEQAEFLKNNLGDIEAAINGDYDAWMRLKTEAANKVFFTADIVANDTDLQNTIINIQDFAQSGYFAQLVAGASLDDNAYLETLKNMLISTGTTAEQMSSIVDGLAAMGIEAHVEYETIYDDIQYDENGVPLPGQKEQKVVKNIHYTKIGPDKDSFSNYSGYSGRQAQNTSKGSGGGGSGGSEKSYEAKTKDPIEEEIDRYERINTLLEAVQNDFENIKKDHDRLAGWNVADVMEEEINLLEKQISLHEEKLKIQREEANELKNSLSSDFGATFDEEGYLLNYANIHKQLESNVNSLIEQYNNTATEDGQNNLEKQIEEAQEKLEDFKETYSRYDELVAGDMKDTINTLKDLEDQIEDIRIEAFNTQIETLDNIRELNDALFEFNELMKVGTVDDLDDPFKGLETSASKLGAYFDNASLKANEYYDNLIARSKEKLADPQVSNEYKKYLQDEIALMEEAKRSAGDGTIEKYGSGYFDMAASNLTDIMAQFDQFLTTGTSSIFGENEAALYEAGQEVFMQFKDILADFWSDAQELRDKILDCINDVGERIEERRAQYEAITDELDHQRNIIEMLHGDKAYDEILNVLDAQQHNYDVSIGEMKQTLDYWTQMRNGLREGSEEWKAVNEKIKETQQNLNELVESSLENLTEIYTQNVNKMLDAWTNSALGNDLEWIEEEWELINRNADYYLDQTNAAYETQKLQNEYLKLLDGSNDLHIQQMITEQMKDQLSYLREKKNISEYDVAYANAQLEILQKRIALEEAQRNKNQIKLRRDSQGNYSYVYTADQEDIAEKEGDLLDAQNNAYNLSKEQMRQTQADSLSALGDAKNLLNNIWTDANLTLEEKQKRTKTIIDSLKEYLAGTSEQLGESQKNIINDFIGMAEMMADENADRLSDVYTEIINGNNDAFFQIDERWSTSLTNWLNTVDEFNNSTDSMFNDLTEKCQNWETATKEVGEQVGQNFDSMAESVDNVRQKTDDLAASQANFINQLKSDAGVVLDYEDTLNSYIAKIADAENEMNKYAQQVKELQGKLTQKEAENASLVSQLEQKSNLGGSGSGGSGGATGGELRVGSFVQLKPGHYYNYTSQGRKPAGNWPDAVKITHIQEGAPYPYHLGTKDANASSASSGWRGWVRKEDLVGYDTGGYTGSWDDNEGRLAMLHQKEIVLNASDTENILKAVQAVRDMTTQLRSNIFNDIAATSAFSGSFALGSGSDTIQQEVHITAEFPNVQDSNDIREALLSLNDQAMQYSSRKR